jgi:hypothetical protein
MKLNLLIVLMVVVGGGEVVVITPEILRFFRRQYIKEEFGAKGNIE